MILKNDIQNRTCYYFDNIMKARDIYSNNLLLDEKICEKHSNLWDFIQKLYEFKTFERTDGFVINSDGIRYLVIFSNIVGLIKYVVVLNIS